MSGRKASNVTIRAVAARAGVSVMTVSNVVNATGRVSPATAEAVRAAIDALGYIPNVAAKRLASTRSTTIALMYTAGRTPFLQELLVGALRATNARGLQLVLHEGEADNPAAAAVSAANLRGTGVNALLLIPPFAELLGASGVLAGIGMPAAAIATGGALPGIATIRIDNRAAMADMTRLVLGHGHRRIGFVAGHPSHGDSAARRAGFDDALQEANVDVPDDLRVAGRFDYASGREAAARLLDRHDPPTAVICSNDEMAAGVIAEAFRRGLSLPNDLSVTGFDDTVVADRLSPPLTVVRQPIELMSFTAVELLVGMMNRAPFREADRVLPYRVIERESLATASPVPAPLYRLPTLQF